MPGQIGEWTVQRTLGSGASCKVKLGVNKESNRKVAIKIMNDNMDEEEKQLLVTEVEAMSKLSHSNVIQTIEYGTDDYHKKGSKKQVDYIILELAQGGEIFDFIAMTGRFEERVARYYFTQFMNGLQYCHKNGIAHRDLKPENLLLDKKFTLKIADFGFAAPLEGRDGSGNLYTNLGTHNYMAPEIHLKQPYKGDQVDLFAAGMILFIMVAQHPPFSSATPKDPYYKCIAANRADIFWKTHCKSKEGGLKFFSEDFKDLFEKMVALDPNGRLSIDEIFAHPWLAEGDIATPEEISKEFKKRNREVQEEVKAAAAEKREEKKIQTSNKKKTMRSAGEIDDESAILKPMKTIEQFDSLFDLKHTQIVSTFNPDIIEDTICKYLEGMGIKYDIKKEKYKIKFDINSSDNGVESTVGMCVRTLRVEEEKFVIEFTKTGGNESKYLEHFREFRNTALEKLNDATLDLVESTE